MKTIIQNATGVFLNVLKLKLKTQKTAGVTVDIEGNSTGVGCKSKTTTIKKIE